MSRTIRRKGIESQMKNNCYEYNKVAGVYSEYDVIQYYWMNFYDEHGVVVEMVLIEGCESVYREPTAQERFKRWKELHSDDISRYSGCVDKDMRRNEQKVHRRHADREIKQFMQGVREDVLIAKATRAQKQYW